MAQNTPRTGAGPLLHTDVTILEAVSRRGSERWDQEGSVRESGKAIRLLLNEWAHAHSTIQVYRHRAGLKGFFTHSKPYFQKFAALVEAGEPGEKLMEIVRAADAKSSVRQAGRNDPCPCGSGKKYKRCCGGARPAA